MSEEEEKLTELFRQIGAEQPELWAKSQHLEGRPQLHRFLFLRQAWRAVVREDDDTWIDKEIESALTRPDRPFAGAGRAMDRMLSSGIPREDIVDLVRSMQVALMSSMCHLLGDPGLTDEEIEVVGDIGWALTVTDDDFEPTDVVIGGLHESVLETDPTGREMRPRPPST